MTAADAESTDAHLGTVRFGAGPGSATVPPLTVDGPGGAVTSSASIIPIFSHWL